MENKRLTKQEQDGLNLFGSLIAMKKDELFLLDNGYQSVFKDIIKKRGLDPEKRYQIGQDGELIEIKKEEPEKKEEQKKK